MNRAKDEKALVPNNYSPPRELVGSTARKARARALMDARISVARYVAQCDSELSTDTHFHLEQVLALLGGLK